MHNQLSDLQRMVGKKIQCVERSNSRIAKLVQTDKNTTVAQITTVVYRRESLNVQHLTELQQQRRTRHCGYNLMGITKTGQTKVGET